jgi:hypothetical protein
MRISSLSKIYFSLWISIFNVSCGQATLKDDGLDSKSIEEAASTTSGGSSNSSFTVSSVSPEDGASEVNKTGATITITFCDDVSLKHTNDSSTTAWTTSSTSEGSCSGSYGSKLVHIPRDSFTNCHPINGSVSGKTITLSLKGTLASLGNYKVKIRKTSLDGSASNQSTIGVQISSEYNSSFTASN